MVHLAQIDAPPRDDGLEKAIQDRLADLDSGKYKRNNAHVLRLCAEWLRRERGVNRVEEITSQDLRQFARALRECMDDEKSNINAGSTVTQYYDYVAAWLGWAVRDQYLDRNPARTETATEPLPEVSTDPDRQFWSDREREAICATTDQLVDVALDNPDEQARRQAYRDRALVYLLAYSGCRGAEIAAVNDDEKRNGLRWSDLNLDDGIISVYGKSREWEEAPLFEPAIEPLRRWKQLLNPVGDDWPVLPTMHLPTLYGELPTDVKTSPDTVWDDLRDHELCPPSLGTDGVRRIVKRLCADSQYEFATPLKPHGARRGLGDTLYREQAELAQDALRHKSIETTHESYSEERTRRVKERGDELFE
ncbi:tyrosine-type recombinase/integrase [Halovenus salina]|uniref:Tyrosine-type recombinase/integrase n=1 Tax=Halovenus salina TaxID=1510225 RepID=A0ABD5W8P5_9EURY|nr:tyrosine-type recombinase/integrase [Halovenus salina]